jgi:hypothetical protein
MQETAADLQAMRVCIEQVFATGHPLQQEATILAYQDSSVDRGYVAWSYSPVWNESGQVDGVIASGSHSRRNWESVSPRIDSPGAPCHWPRLPTCI